MCQRWRLLLSAWNERFRIRAWPCFPLVCPYGVDFFGSEKAYQKARQAVIKKGNYRRVLSKAGEWYDDFDSHSRCG